MKVEAATGGQAQTDSSFAIPTLWSHEDYDHSG
jgi:hypothetical protein